MPSLLTVADLHAQLQVMESDLDAAVSAYLADPSTYLFRLPQGFGVDLAAAVQASALARSVIARPDSTTAQRRAALRRAILAAPLVRE